MHKIADQNACRGLIIQESAEDNTNRALIQAKRIDASGNAQSPADREQALAMPIRVIRYFRKKVAKANTAHFVFRSCRLIFFL